MTFLGRLGWPGCATWHSYPIVLVEVARRSLTSVVGLLGIGNLVG